jgi:hypothetical protein
LQNFTLEAPQRALQRLTVLNVNFGQRLPPDRKGNTKRSCCREEYRFAVVYGRGQKPSP